MVKSFAPTPAFKFTRACSDIISPRRFRNLPREAAVRDRVTEQRF